MAGLFENNEDSIEKTSYFDYYYIYNENQNQFMNWDEYGDEVSSFSNSFTNPFHRNSEYIQDYNNNDYLEGMNDKNPKPCNKSTSNTEMINPETVKSKNKKIKIFTIKKILKEKKVLNQKRNRTKNNNNNREKKHTKYAFDNIANKIRRNLFKGILVILNKSLEDQDITREEKSYMSQVSGKIETKMRNKSLYKVNFSKYGKTVKGNLDLLNMPLRQIFYQDCSEKYKNYRSNNKNLLDEISDNNSFNKTNQILEMTVLQCLEQFRGSKKYDALDGLEKECQNLLKEFERKRVEKAYIEQFKTDLKDFEQKFQIRRWYKSGKSKEVKII